MRVIINEIKKILSVKNILIIGAMFFVLWRIFIGPPYIDYFAQGLPDLPHFNLSEKMLNEFGETIDEKEMQQFKDDTIALEKEVDKYISQRDDAKAIGVESYRDLQDGWIDNPDINELHSKIIFDDENYFVQELVEREYLIERYDTKEEWLSHRINTNNIERINEAIISEDSNSVLNFVVLRNYDWIISNFSMIILITIAFIMSPVFLNDNKSKITYSQYSSKRGRKLASSKVLAGIVSTLIIVSIGVIVLFIMYSQNNTLQFWNCSINSIFTDMTSWFNLTFGQYIVLSVILMYIVALVVSVISMYVSSKVNSNITLIGIQIPIIAIIIAMLKTIGMYEITNVFLPKYTVHFIYGTMVLIAIILTVKLLKDEKIKNI